MANTVKQIPFNVNLPERGLVAQEDGSLYNYANTKLNPSTAVVDHSSSPVAVTRASAAVSHNPTRGNLTLAPSNNTAFGDLGIQSSRQVVNSLSNSDMRSGTTGYTLTDTGGIVTTSAAQDSSLGESDRAFRLTMNNTSGSLQTVEVYQSISGVSLDEWWSAQARVLTIQRSDPSIVALLRIVDIDNANISSSNIGINTDVYELTSISQKATGASTDFRISFYFQVPDTETLDVKFTNTMLAQSPWETHYVPSTTGPTTRNADVIDIGASGDPFFVHLTDEMWSVDFKTLGSLATISGENQLQYLFSSYNGVNGTNLFVDDPNTITWHADFNGTPENVTVVMPSALGQLPYRVYFRILTNGGNYDRQMFVERLDTGDIEASTVLTTANLPIHGDVMKLGRDDSDANNFDGFLGRLTYWGNRSNESMDRINDNWPVT